ncbi:translation initiation factor IF-2 [Candidatus Woesebacteria bacterium]|nr:translation initiation factor IF-2 [Candidatus Woesebacteria bacterium]
MAVQKRAPIVTIMGHVDHGKTSLLDYIRNTRVTAREAGGITQHIGAYMADFKGNKITFIDTPGHAAFNKMRERGAKITDIIVLVVAADDGVKPQTIESIRHIAEAKVPFVVAINKMDLATADPTLVKSQLVEHGIAVQGFGGSIDAIELSAKTGAGVDTLLETLTVMAQLNEYSADPDAPLKAVVIESSLDNRKGTVASVIVQQGTMRPRQDIYTETADGRIRLLSSETGEQLQAVTPGMPAEVIAFKSVPEVGEIVRDAAADYSSDVGVEEEEIEAPTTFADFDFGALLEQKPKLNLLIKADVSGTLEAITQTLDMDSVQLVGSGVGQVTESDIELAHATDALIIAFHIKVSPAIKQSAKNVLVKIKSYDVIYHLIEDLQKQMLKMMDSTIDEVVTGEAEIMQIFEMRGERIAGVKVKTGILRKVDLLHLKRNDEIVLNPVIKSMMHGKQEVDEINTKNEGGLTFKNRKLDFQVGDTIIAYKIADE